MAKVGRGAAQYNLRLPDGLKESLMQAATQSGRSFNSEAILRLEASFKGDRSLESEIARLIDEHVQRRVSDRLRAIASKIGE